MDGLCEQWVAGPGLSSTCAFNGTSTAYLPGLLRRLHVVTQAKKWDSVQYMLSPAVFLYALHRDKERRQRLRAALCMEIRGRAGSEEGRPSAFQSSLLSVLAL